jgi:hypothetical protein
MSRHASRVSPDPSPLDHNKLEALPTILRAATAQVEAILNDKPATRRWLSTSEAAEVGHVGSQQTIRNWCKRYEVGIRVRGVWQVDSILLEQLLRGRSRVTAP